MYYRHLIENVNLDTCCKSDQTSKKKNMNFNLKIEIFKQL
jgi:hypothetical protein